MFFVAKERCILFCRDEQNSSDLYCNIALLWASFCMIATGVGRQLEDTCVRRIACFCVLICCEVYVCMFVPGTSSKQQTVRVSKRERHRLSK